MMHSLRVVIEWSFTKISAVCAVTGGCSFMETNAPDGRDGTLISLASLVELLTHGSRILDYGMQFFITI